MIRKRQIKVITDSGCDLPQGWEAKYGIDIMHFEIMLDDVIYCERTDVTPQEFYTLMNNSESIPTTNQITIPRFEAKFRQCIADGEREILMILINSKGSQTYFNALKAKENLTESGELSDTTIHIIDSRTYSLGYGYAVVEAVKKLDSGQSIEQVLAYLNDWFESAQVYIIPLNLRHMKKSGRITAAAAFLGEIMGLKPVIQLIDGVSTVVKKSRGEKAVLEDAARFIKNRAIPSAPWVALCGEDEGFYGDFLRKMTATLGTPALESQLGCVVGANTGPKMAALVIKGENRGEMKHS